MSTELKTDNLPLVATLYPDVWAKYVVACNREQRSEQITFKDGKPAFHRVAVASTPAPPVLVPSF